MVAFHAFCYLYKRRRGAVVEVAIHGLERFHYGEPSYVAYLRAGGRETDPNYEFIAWVTRKAAEFKRLNGIGGLYTEEVHGVVIERGVRIAGVFFVCEKK